PEVHARGYIAITSSLIEYLLAKLLRFGESKTGNALNGNDIKKRLTSNGQPFSFFKKKNGGVYIKYNEQLKKMQKQNTWKVLLLMIG
ncbi:hypothetical protein BTI04_09185, partial [Lactobacillus delbrueckii subsp. bulgaricus]|nr:hypothetical protein [Lactobacillus delbrueckii subsp. bulgaricus]MBT8821496.1 hypothetical protein [Lactobacillus delbrueckii subsp. bulgaricus]MBT8846890.1 hypothetical protein [Lactobacillus delbrueckii subsp. bulgaricus]